jgi:hypothetical protein
MSGDPLNPGTTYPIDVGGGTPVLIGVTSRKSHGAAGTFALPLQ